MNPILSPFLHLLDFLCDTLSFFLFCSHTLSLSLSLSLHLSLAHTRCDLLSYLLFASPASVSLFFPLIISICLSPALTFSLALSSFCLVKCFLSFCSFFLSLLSLSLCSLIPLSLSSFHPSIYLSLPLSLSLSLFPLALSLPSRSISLSPLIFPVSSCHF